MFTDIYNIDKINEEAGLYLSSLEDAEDNDKKLVDEFANIATAISSSSNPAYMLTLLKRYYDSGILTPLSLKIEEFDLQEGVSPNKRFPAVVLHTTGQIEYTKAFAPKIQHVYDIDKNEEVLVFPDYLDTIFNYGSPIWITKGGCCIGEYISGIYLKETTVNKHSFVPHPPILLPLSLEVRAGFKRWSIDCREPKLKALKEYYDVNINPSDCKFNIRKYIKLK